MMEPQTLGFCSLLARDAYLLEKREKRRKKKIHVYYLNKSIRVTPWSSCLIAHPFGRNQSSSIDPLLSFLFLLSFCYTAAPELLPLSPTRNRPDFEHSNLWYVLGTRRSYSPSSRWSEMSAAASLHPRTPCALRSGGPVRQEAS